MFWKYFFKKLSNVQSLFLGHYVEVKHWYVQLFDSMPCVVFVGEVDTTQVYAQIFDLCKEDVLEVYQHNFYDHETEKIRFNNTVFVLTDERMIELGNNYCHVLHHPKQYDWAFGLIRQFSKHKLKTDNHQSAVIGFARPTSMN